MKTFADASTQVLREVLADNVRIVFLVDVIETKDFEIFLDQCVLTTTTDTFLTVQEVPV